ncbi:MAG TPA: hypothetical protein VFL34_03375 [Candidatus Sulfotelmatobacter sp.]|nr:hypothetical protein [Candidatus Sulfotelmatobacter sp.]
MTLLDAQEYDPEKARKRRMQIISAIAILLVALALGWWFRYWPYEHIAGKFFDALQKQDYKTAYGIWMHDPQWQQHPDQYPKYPFNEFYTDWGPGGQWGLIKTQKVYGASSCPGGGTGVVVDVIVNDRAEHAQVWVEKSDHTLSYPPCELLFR